MGAELGILPHVGNVRSHLGCKGVGSRWLTVPKDKWVLHLAGRRVAASPIDEGRVCWFEGGYLFIYATVASLHLRGTSRLGLVTLTNYEKASYNACFLLDRKFVKGWIKVWVWAEPKIYSLLNFLRRGAGNIYIGHRA